MHSMCTRYVAVYVHDILRKFIFTSSIIGYVFGNRKYKLVQVNKKFRVQFSNIFHTYDFWPIFRTKSIWINLINYKIINKIIIIIIIKLIINKYYIQQYNTQQREKCLDLIFLIFL